MKNQLLKQLKSSILVGLVIGVLLFLFNFYKDELIHDLVWEVYSISFFIALLIAFYNAYVLSKQQANLVPMMLGSTVIRLLLSIGALFYFLVKAQEDRLSLAILFMLIYLCFMLFEIIGLITNLRPISTKSEHNDKNTKSESI